MGSQPHICNSCMYGNYSSSSHKNPSKITSPVQQSPRVCSPAKPPKWPNNVDSSSQHNHRKIKCANQGSYINDIWLDMHIYLLCDCDGSYYRHFVLTFGRCWRKASYKLCNKAWQGFCLIDEALKTRTWVATCTKLIISWYLNLGIYINKYTRRNHKKSLSLLHPVDSSRSSESFKSCNLRVRHEAETEMMLKKVVD